MTWYRVSCLCKYGEGVREDQRGDVGVWVPLVSKHLIQGLEFLTYMIRRATSASKHDSSVRQAE